MPRTPISLPSYADLAALAAAVASLPDDVVVSHRSAAAVWGLWTPTFYGIEVTSPAGAQGSRYTTGVQRRSVVAHRRLLDPADVVEHAGLRVTTPARTWLDLAPLLDLHDLVAAGDSALIAGADHAEMTERAHALRRTRGIVAARQAATVLNASSRSRPESRIRAALQFSGLPAPLVNEAVVDPVLGWLGEPDLHYPQARLAIEYNGADHADVDRMRRDSVRLLDFQRADWTVRTYTAVHAFSRLDEVVADVRSLLRRRAPELLTAPHLARRVTYLGDGRRRNRRH